MVAVFAFLFPQLGTYEQALAQLAAIPVEWLVVLVLAGIANILLYPLTAIAAIPGLKYRYAFVDRQTGFMISNVIPGGGAVAVGTQFTILSRYGVPSGAAAAAVAADAIWTYLMVLGTPALAMLFLVIEGRSTAGMVTAAVVGLIVLLVSVAAITVILRSESGARRTGSLLQGPADRLWHLVRRDPPDVTARLVEFHVQASTLFATRWPALTITNTLAQLTPYAVLVAALGRPRRLSGTAHVGGDLRGLLGRTAAHQLPHHPWWPGHGGRGTGSAPAPVRRTRIGGHRRRSHLAARLVPAPTARRAGRTRGIFTWGRRRAPGIRTEAHSA